MPSSLGIYIEDNLIKYAKVVKEKDSYKIDVFNVVFYENLGETLEKIINETNSSRIPICVNISNELYNYYDVFSMLNKNDIRKSIDLEFDMLCNDNKYNKDSLETRFILVTNREDSEKVKALHIAANKSDIGKKLQQLAGYKVASITPISTSITNLIDVSPKDSVAIINIENETKITTIIDGQINRVDTIEIGMGQILEDINKTENSMQKSYDVCRNMTIYTQDNTGVQDDNEHIEEIMPTLYKLVTESKRIVDGAFASVSRVYITGLGAAINNIDLYFQEYMLNVKCEILKPFFMESSSVKIPVKEYIEVNSATALALEVLGYGNKELNFANARVGSIKSGKFSGAGIARSIKNLFSTGGTTGIKGAFSGPLSVLEKLMLRLIAVCAIAVIVYGAISVNTMEQIETKTKEVTATLAETRSQISKINSDYSKITSKTSTYTSLINSINNLSDSSAEAETTRVIAKDAIPNLLNRLMFVIPQKVVVTSIKNTQGAHIVIEAQSEKYEQLGYFKAVLDTKGILVDVKSTSGMKEGGLVKVTIEGELP